MNNKCIYKLWSLLQIKPTTDVWERFCTKVESYSWTECWNWQAARSSNGYGQFTLPKRIQCGAHRLIAKWVYGDFPNFLQVDHLVCNNKRCVNPLHLLPTTPQKNTLRSLTGPSAINARKTHCKNGHEFTPDNLVPQYLKRGQRKCLICHNQWNYNYYQKTKAATNLTDLP